MFIKHFAVNIDPAALDHDRFSWHTDNSFDVIDVRVDRSFKNDHIPAVGFAEAVADFISDDIFIILESRLHGGAFDFMRLDNKKINDHKNRQSYDNSFQEIKDKI